MSMQKDKSTSKVKVDYKDITFNPTTDLKSPLDILGNIIAARHRRVILISDFKNISDKGIFFFINGIIFLSIKYLY